MARSLTNWFVKTFLIAVASTLFSMSDSHAVPACDVVMGIPGNAPFTGLQGLRVTGVIGEAAVEVLQTVDCDVEPRQLPFPRMYKWVHDSRIGVATSVLKTPDRALLAHYTQPIVTEYTVVMVPKDRAFTLNSVADLEGKLIGGRLGFKYPPIEGTNIELVRERSYAINIQKVADRRLDGALIGSITGPYIAEQLGLSDQIEFLPKALGKVELGLALSHTSFSDEQSRRLDTEITNLLQSPRWHKILDRNGIRQLVRPWPVIPRPQRSDLNRTK
ncbi:MAG: transporter substrate-binding domain-containing protein [Alphaproteobacteria bacterium]|nr:transporter substrate-binding domain-containing protein [Alphaproteobacteria bacterium]